MTHIVREVDRPGSSTYHRNNRLVREKPTGPQFVREVSMFSMSRCRGEQEGDRGGGDDCGDAAHGGGRRRRLHRDAARPAHLQDRLR